MIPVLSRAQMREFDRRASHVCNVPSLILMENAGRGAADVIASELGLGRGKPRRVVIVCGTGNNGGDGFVVARRLLGLGADVRLFLLGHADALKGDARVNYDAWLGVGGSSVELSSAELIQLSQALENADGVVDALFGTGLDREVVGTMRYAIEFINGARCPKFALDVPSGLDAETGSVLGIAVRADVTVTFAHHKLGLLTPLGVQHAGRVVVADIGVPASGIEHVGYAAEIQERRDVAPAFAPRSVTAHKASVGRVVVIAGSPGKIGAALLVAQGALRAGAGLVTIAAVPSAAATLEQRVLEAMTARIDPDNPAGSLDLLLENADAIAIGPGIGLDAMARKIVDHVVLRSPATLVVDADAITHFRGRAQELRGAEGDLILTPHSAEIARIVGHGALEVEASRFNTVERCVELTNQIVLLKGYRTLIGAPRERMVVNPTGTPALATGGTGDVLTGIIAGLACTLDARRAACVGAFIHGLAAERWVSRVGADRGLLAHEIADEIPATIAALSAPPGLLTD